MTYRFVVNDHPGTYWYHGHSGLAKVGTRGIAGMLTVKPKESSYNPHEDLYNAERELFLQDWSHEAPGDSYLKSMGSLHPPVGVSANAHYVALFPWVSGLMNGKGIKGHSATTSTVKYSVINIDAAHENQNYTKSTDQLTTPLPTTGTRLRIVNGGEVYALKISVDRHKLLIISTDGTDTDPLEVDAVVAHVGERFDAVLLPRELEDTYDYSKDNGNFWIRATTLETDEGVQIPNENQILGILRYEGSPDVVPQTHSYPAAEEVVLNCFDSYSRPSSIERLSFRWRIYPIRSSK
ncbi:unnamed protein product [Pseudo-nitzschia multistriata]|uniref:Plastocyanin-like domain-containing protein n=1 Tax=Pseudo-nitzschia multistriata TaxID=183589 RepID=A0A448Z6A1_9STRA|nr:unnamed protein product [Pseudo-nitzschia multistriata]